MASVMKKIEINSNKFGKQIVLISYEDYPLVKGYTWRVTKSRSGTLYATTAIYIPEKQNNKTLFMHNLIMGVRGIDHINRNGLDNRRDNLRVATQRQNAKNQSTKITNKYGVKGVSYDAKNKMYSCHITNDYKHIFIGYFFSVVEAAMKYNEASEIFHGEYGAKNILSEEQIKELKKYDLPHREFPQRKNNSTGFRGVNPAPNGKFFGKIKANGRQIHLGTFKTAKEAAAAYNSASVMYYGDRAILNCITNEE
jgi:hypothetical protein